MARGDARAGKWRGNWRMEWVASTLHITSEHGVSSITTADAHTSVASSRLNWRPCRYNTFNAELNPICHLLALLGAHHIFHVSRIRVKWTRPFRRKTKSRFCACAVTFQAQSATFLRILINGTTFVRISEHQTYVLWFSITILSEKFLILRRIQWLFHYIDFSQHNNKLTTTYPVADRMIYYKKREPVHTYICTNKYI